MFPTVCAKVGTIRPRSSAMSGPPFSFTKAHPETVWRTIEDDVPYHFGEGRDDPSSVVRDVRAA
ncbi:MAG: hypothetical protein AAF357_13860, partial [Verrucomicrobiota bacterium]